MNSFNLNPVMRKSIVPFETFVSHSMQALNVKTGAHESDLNGLHNIAL